MQGNIYLSSFEEQVGITGLNILIEKATQAFVECSEKEKNYSFGSSGFDGFVFQADESAREVTSPWKLRR